MAVGDRFKVTVHQTLFTEPLVNVFCYEQTGGTGGAFELGTAFLSDVWDVVQTTQSDEVLTSHVEVINEDDDTDFSSILCTSGCAGTRTGDTMPRFVAWAFRLNRASRASRHGQKRIAGPVETDITDGVANALITTNLANAASAMKADVDDGLGNTWEIKIARYNDLGALIATFNVSSVQYVRVSTQNSRK